MKRFLLMLCLLMAFGAPSAMAAFTDNGDGTVTDSSTGLMWQRVAADDSDVLESGVSLTWDAAGVKLDWENALTYCENLVLAGYHDWRLPDRNELQSIVNYTGPMDPLFDPAGENLADYYWTSTSYVMSADRAWMVNFCKEVDGSMVLPYGYAGFWIKTNKIRVRAVRK